MVNVSTTNSGDTIYYGPDGTAHLYNNGDLAWVTVSTALVWLMIPGVGFFYSGLLRRKNALSMIHMSMLAIAVTSVQWMLFGFSLTFTDTGGRFIGNFDYAGLKNALGQPSTGSSKVPFLLYNIYQLMFSAITSALAFGASAERCRIGPLMIIMFLWSTIVYAPIAYSTWNPNGWANRLGDLDFAGGGPVHMTSGLAGLAMSIFLGKRRGYGTGKLSFRPQNTSYVVLGTVFLWVGWFGFNGGSALGMNLRAIQACVVTNLAASVSGLTWMFWDWRLERKWSVVGFCSGAIAGLVAITPGAGFVGSPAALAFGVAAGTFCNFSTRIKFLIQVDDALDIFASHGVGGFVGSVCTGIFAQTSVASFDGSTPIKGGWINGHFVQLGYQLAAACFTIGWSFVITMLLLYIINFIPGCHFRLSEDAEIIGMDDSELGEFCYDYVALNLGGPAHDIVGEATPHDIVSANRFDHGSSNADGSRVEKASRNPHGEMVGYAS